MTILEIALKWLIVMIANTADSMADQLSMIAETTNAIFKRGHPYFVRLFIFCPFCHFFNFCPFDPFFHFLSSLSICSIFFNIVQKLIHDQVWYIQKTKVLLKRISRYMTRMIYCHLVKFRTCMCFRVCVLTTTTPIFDSD